MSESTVDRNPFERLAEEFAERLRRGEHPSLAEYVGRCPEHADDIRELFPALALVEHYKSSPDNSEPLSFAAVPTTRGDLPDRLGDYRILRYLGEGGMGVVYEAVRESLHSHVALKVMHAQYRKREKYQRRFRTEARAAARLHHTNIVSVFDYGVADGVCYYAMQHIAGQSLDKILVELRELRREKMGVAADESATRATGPNQRSVSGQGDSPSGTDEVSTDRLIELVRSVRQNGTVEVSTGLLSRPITLGLLTGRYAAIIPAGTSDKGETTPLPTSDETPGVIADADGLQSSAGEVSVLECTVVKDEHDNAGISSRSLQSELGQAQAIVPPAPEQPPDSGEAPGSAQPSAEGSTSALMGKSDGRYYREVARLGAQVAEALAYAHQRSVLHRDIKPPNLILDPLGNIWITDFGLAKFEEGDDLSQSRDIVGTLRYMAPERLRGISTAQSDIYALGTTLYEMLTLRPPFEEQDQLRLLRRIENDAPLPLRQLDRHIPPDLETIVLKALEKDPNHRFASAEEMAGELRLFVQNRPIPSRPIPVYQQFWRWCRRNPGLAGANITAAVLTTLLAIVSTVAAITLARAEHKTRLQLFEALHDRARAGRFSHRAGQRFDSLEALKQAVKIGRELKLPPERFEALRDETIACMALPDLKPTGQVFRPPPGAIKVAVDPTMTRYALRFRDGTISVRRVADDREIGSFTARGEREIFVFVFSPDGRYIATMDQPGRALIVWDIERRVDCLNDRVPVPGNSVSFSPDSRRIALLNESRELLIYDLATRRLTGRSRVAGLGGLAFRPDGVQLAVLDSDSNPATCRILDVETGRHVRTISLRPSRDNVAWSPDGTTLAVPGKDHKIDLWDASTGIRRTTLEGHFNEGIHAAFHPAGTLLASSNWENRLRLWDPILGRPWLSLAGYSGLVGFRPDGRIGVWVDGQLATYQVDPALEYRTFAHASREPMNYTRLSIRVDGRVLAVGTDRGAVLWDLARGTELAFLPIGNSWHLMFDPSGDLITSGEIGVYRWPVRIKPELGGEIGVYRWPVRIKPELGEYRIGPPHRLALPAGDCGIAMDGSGRIVAKADHNYAYIASPERTSFVGPLDDCRGVAVSPDGQWLATGTHSGVGAQVWRISDLKKVAELPIDYGTGVHFSPDGKWLLTESPPCRLWEVGSWREARQIGGQGWGFSSDDRLMAVKDGSRILRLVDTKNGRTLAQFESPDSHDFGWAILSPDGSRLVVSTNDPPCVHVWDLRAIRENLAGMGLDWDAPAYPDDDPAGPSAPPLPPLSVDFGPLTGHIEHYTEDAGSLVARYTGRLKDNPNDAEAYHYRGHALDKLKRNPEAIADLTRAIQLRPGDAHYRHLRGAIYRKMERYEPAIADLETALTLKPDEPAIRVVLALCCNNRAWELAKVPGPRRDLDRALALTRRAVDLAPGETLYVNTMGVVLYRAGQYEGAIATLERSLAAGRGQSDGFDLFFLAMAHHRMGRRELARGCYDRALLWLGNQKALSKAYTDELARFRAEAEAVLAGPVGELPDDVFTPE